MDLDYALTEKGHVYRIWESGDINLSLGSEIIITLPLAKSLCL